MAIDKEKNLDGGVAVDSESISDRFAGENKLVRQLKNRHVAMIRYGRLLSATLVIF